MPGEAHINLLFYSSREFPLSLSLSLSFSCHVTALLLSSLSQLRFWYNILHFTMLACTLSMHIGVLHTPQHHAWCLGLPKESAPWTHFHMQAWRLAHIQRKWIGRSWADHGHTSTVVSGNGHTAHRGVFEVSVVGLLGIWDFRTIISEP